MTYSARFGKVLLVARARPVMFYAIPPSASHAERATAKPSKYHNARLPLATKAVELPYFWLKWRPRPHAASFYNKAITSNRPRLMMILRLSGVLTLLILRFKSLSRREYRLRLF